MKMFFFTDFTDRFHPSLKMDLQTMLISVAVTLVSAIVIYHIYACGVRELTYDEVIAEQRRLHLSEVGRSQTLFMWKKFKLEHTFMWKKVGRLVENMLKAK